MIAFLAALILWLQALVPGSAGLELSYQRCDLLQGHAYVVCQVSNYFR